MLEKTTIIKIGLTALMIIGLLALTFVIGGMDANEKDQRAIESLREVLQMKHQKQTCVDDLTALQTEEYLKGVGDHCKTDDEKIIELKNIINETINGFEYENIDAIIMQKKTEQLAMATGSKLEEFMGLLQTE